MSVKCDWSLSLHPGQIPLSRQLREIPCAPHTSAMPGQPFILHNLQQTRNPLARNRRKARRDKSDMGMCVAKLAGLEEHEKRKGGRGMASNELLYERDLKK